MTDQTEAATTTLYMIEDGQCSVDFDKKANVQESERGDGDNKQAMR